MEFKVVLVGDGGVGKSSLVRRFRFGDFEEKYVITLGVDTHPLTFDTTRGKITLNVWDLAGQEKFAGTRNKYIAGAQGCLAMFDLTSRITFKNLPVVIDEVKAVVGEIPIVCCGNKSDLGEVKVPLAERKRLAAQYPYFEISVRNNVNYRRPFLQLMREMVGDSSLNFVA
jgi:GTP-binding nuclear protein Ran